MQVDDAFFENVLKLMDSLMAMTRNKIIWQNVALSQLGQEGRQKFEEFRGNPQLLAEIEACLVDVRKMRKNIEEVWDRLRRGEPFQWPTDQTDS